MKLAGVGRRAIAALIDSIVMIGIGYVIAVMAGQTSENGFQLVGLPALIWFLSMMIYLAAAEVGFGATIGKALLGLRVEMLDGSPMSWEAAFIRNLVRPVDYFPFGLIGAIAIWTSDNKQRLGDRAAATVVRRI